MKLCRLYLAEDAESDAKNPDLGVSKPEPEVDASPKSKISSIVDAALGGVSRAIMFLGAIIYHGLLGKAVAAKEVKPDRAALALAMTRTKEFQDILAQKVEELKQEREKILKAGHDLDPDEVREYEERYQRYRKIFEKHKQDWLEIARLISDLPDDLQRRAVTRLSRYFKPLDRELDPDKIAEMEERILKRLKEYLKKLKDEGDEASESDDSDF